MLRFFRSSKTSVLVVVFLLGGLTWLHALVEPDVQQAGLYGTFLFGALVDLSDNIPSSAVWPGLILVLAFAGILIYVNNKLRLIDKVSYLPGLCYLLLIGGVPTIHRLNPEIIAGILIIIGFTQLVKSFESEKLSYQYFTAPIFISIATFFYQYAYVYMAVVWLAILLLRPGYWREWVFSVLGFAFPIFVAFSCFFLVDGDYTRMSAFFGEIFSLERLLPDLSIAGAVFFATSISVVVFTFGHLMRYLGSKKIIIRNGYYILILIAVTCTALVCMAPDTLPFAWYIAAFPLSFFTANYLATVRSVRWGTGILIFLFASVIISQIIYLV